MGYHPMTREAKEASAMLERGRILLLKEQEKIGGNCKKASINWIFNNLRESRTVFSGVIMAL